MEALLVINLLKYFPITGNGRIIPGNLALTVFDSGVLPSIFVFSLESGGRGSPCNAAFMIAKFLWYYSCGLFQDYAVILKFVITAYENEENATGIITSYF